MRLQHNLFAQYQGHRAAPPVRRYAPTVTHWARIAERGDQKSVGAKRQDRLLDPVCCRLSASIARMLLILSMV